MENNEFQNTGENKRVVGPYIVGGKRQKKRKRGLVIGVCILLVLIILFSAGMIYWRLFVKPPEANVPAFNDSNPQIGLDDSMDDLDPAEMTAEELARMQAIIEEQAQEIDLSGVAQKDGYFTVLVVGTDASAGLTDTIIVATFNTNDKSVSILNIPRDTISRGKDGTTYKINSAYMRGGIDRLKTEVKNILGFEVNRYVIVHFYAFSRIIDAIGGIEIDVPRDMYKNTGDMIIDLKAGLQTLDGEQALMYMRYRGYANADIERIGAQQSFYRAVIEKLATPATILKLPSLTSIVTQNVETDLAVGEMIWIGTNYANMDTEDVLTNTLPHTARFINDVSYVLPIEKQILEMVNGNYNPYGENITRLNLADVPVERSDDNTSSSDDEDDQNEEDDADTTVPGWISGGGN